MFFCVFTIRLVYCLTGIMSDLFIVRLFIVRLFIVRLFIVRLVYCPSCLLSVLFIVRQTACQSVNLSVCLPVSLSTCLSVCLSIFPCVCVCVCLSVMFGLCIQYLYKKDYLFQSYLCHAPVNSQISKDKSLPPPPPVLIHIKIGNHNILLIFYH